MPSNMKISVNNQSIEVSGQRPLIEELRNLGIDVPSMCYAEGYEHHPSCMVCMVKDVATGQMLPSCSVMPYEGMQIETDSDEIHQLRRLSLELLLSDHRADCEAPCTIVCPQGIDVAQVILHYDHGEFEEARRLLQGTTCDDCKKTCEKACRRGTVDERVKICEIIDELRKTKEELYDDAIPENMKEKTTSSEKNAFSRFEHDAIHPNSPITRPFNSRLGRFSDAEKERLKKIYTQPSHCLHCTCDGRSTCELRRLASKAGIKASRYGIKSSLPVKEAISVTGRLIYEPAKCIRCGLCVYNTQDAFTFERRGFDMRVVIPEKSKKHVSEKIAKLCPTGALVLKLLMPLMLLLTGCRSLPEGANTITVLPHHPQLLWEHRHEVRTVASPKAYDGMILFCNKHGQMIGLDEDTGEKQFNISLGSDVEASFTIEDSILYVGQIDGQIRSLSLSNGNELWNYQTEGQIAATPVLATISGQRRLFVGSYDNYMYTLSPQTGQLIHRVPTEYYINGAVGIWQDFALFGGCDSWVRMVNGITGEASDSLRLDAYIPASPIVVENNVYIADYLGNVYELTLGEGRILNHRKLLTAKKDDDGGMLSTPVVTDKDIFLLTPNRRLVCLDRRSGRECWHTVLKGDVGESSPVLVKDRLLVCTKTGVISIHDASTGQQFWEYETGEQIITQPIVGNNCFYVLTARGTLLCFSEKTNI